MGTKASDANRITREYMDSILITERLIGSVEPDTETEIFGHKYASPIMMPAFSHLKPFGEGRENGLVEYAKAAKQKRLLNWIGMCENDAYDEIAAVGVPTVRIVKPYKDNGKIMDQLLHAQEAGAVAVGIDTDHIFGGNGKYDVVLGEEMTCQSAKDIERYVSSLRIPFVIKGVLSKEDAAICLDCGVKGIVVSHHSGRLPFAVPPLSVLPEIREKVGDKMTVFVDCHIDTGADVFKALALGADAVSVGRAMMPALTENGIQGVADYVEGMEKELKMIMAFTGAGNVSGISRDVLRFTTRIAGY